MNILFDRELRWRKVMRDSRRTVLPKRLGDNPMWENFDGYRLLVMGVEPPRPGEIWSCILTKHRYKASDLDKRLIHRVIRLVKRQISTEYDKTITEMIESNDIPYGTLQAKGKGRTLQYGESPTIYTIKMPSELRNDLEVDATRLGVSLNRLVVTLIDIGREHWDEEEIRY